MAEKQAKKYTHRVTKYTDHFRREPKEGDPPDGQFEAGTPVRLINVNYLHTNTPDLQGDSILDQEASQ